MASERTAQHFRTVYREAGPAAVTAKFANPIAATPEVQRLALLAKSSGAWKAASASSPDNTIVGWVPPDEMAAATGRGKPLAPGAVDLEGAGLAFLGNSGRPSVDDGLAVPATPIGALLERI